MSLFQSKWVLKWPIESLFGPIVLSQPYVTTAISCIVDEFIKKTFVLSKRFAVCTYTESNIHYWAHLLS